MNIKRYIQVAAPKICPVCGEEVPRNALACLECGADHNSGWREDADSYDGVNLPENDFNYDGFVKQEFGSKGKPAGIRTIWWIAGVLLIVVLVLYFVAAR